MNEFLQRGSTVDAYWRSVILFGDNSASYKFALGKALLELANTERTFISLSELALPYALNLADHLKHTDRQGTSPGSQFLEVIRAFNKQEIPEDSLRTATVKLGFNNVLDAFHVVNQAPIEYTFFEKDFRRSDKGIVVTDNLLGMRALGFDTL